MAAADILSIQKFEISTVDFFQGGIIVPNFLKIGQTAEI